MKWIFAFVLTAVLALPLYAEESVEFTRRSTNCRAALPHFVYLGDGPAVVGRTGTLSLVRGPSSALAFRWGEQTLTEGQRAWDVTAGAETFNILVAPLHSGAHRMAELERGETAYFVLLDRDEADARAEIVDNAGLSQQRIPVALSQVVSFTAPAADRYLYATGEMTLLIYPVCIEDAPGTIPPTATPNEPVEPTATPTIGDPVALFKIYLPQLVGNSR